MSDLQQIIARYNITASFLAIAKNVTQFTMQQTCNKDATRCNKDATRCNTMHNTRLIRLKCLQQLRPKYCIKSLV